MSKRPAELFLEDIREAIEKIQRFTKGMDRAAFLGDEKSVDAVVRNLEIVGEAARQLPDDFKRQHAHIEWHKIAGLRKRIVHDYFGLDLEIIWQIIQTDLPVLKRHLQTLR